MKIAICDDDRDAIEKLANTIKKYSENRQIDITVNKYYDGKSLISASAGADMIFLDIEMEPVNGIETAATLRIYNATVPIVYITNYPDYWQRAYKVHAFDYIIKPFEEKSVFRAIDDYFTAAKDNQAKKILLTTERGIVVQNKNEICYFIFKQKNILTCNTVYKEYIVKDNLSNIIKTLDSDDFYRTHKSCVVNLKYVNSMNKNNGIIMNDGTWLPLALRKQQEFYYFLSKRLRDE